MRGHQSLVTPDHRRQHCGGGFGGMIVTIESYTKAANRGIGVGTICVVVGLIYATGLVLGVRFAERQKSSWPLIVFYLLKTSKPA
jgi:hypothetical protein